MAFGYEKEVERERDAARAECAALREENEQLKTAIRRLADQDATLSICNGNVTVTMDATLTDAEREAVWALASHHLDDATFGTFAKTLCSLFERTNVTEYPRSKSLPTVMPDQLDAVIEGLERIKALEAEIAHLRDEIARLRLSYMEQEALKSAQLLFEQSGLSQHAVIVRLILQRINAQ